eukprot:2170166-Amphidinium_carterae.1
MVFPPSLHNSKALTTLAVVTNVLRELIHCLHSTTCTNSKSSACTSPHVLPLERDTTLHLKVLDPATRALCYH